MVAPVPKEEVSWTPTVATVTHWRRTYDTWFVDEATPDDAGSYQLAKFVISFSYSANGTRYTGRYTAGSPKEIGETFEIRFNPHDPQRNTGSDKAMNPWIRAAAWSVGIAIAWLLIKFFPDSL